MPSSSQIFIPGSFLVCYFILLIRSQHPKGDPWRNCESTKISSEILQQVVPKGAWGGGIGERMDE